MVNASKRIRCTECVAQNVCHVMKVASVFKLRVGGSNFKLDYVLTFSIIHCTIQEVGANFYFALHSVLVLAFPKLNALTHTVRIA